MTTAASATPANPLPVHSGPRPLGLRFVGSTPEYFRIWIVNVCLTLLTLGVFSAWAKVRKKRYFYSHTLLDDTPFQYLGQPIPILKGRLIAAALLGAWYVGTHYVIELAPVVLVIALVMAPWVAVRSAAFNARYSAYRNMTFHFSGSYWRAAKVIYGWAVVALLTLGIGGAWWQQRVKRFMVSHMGYGGISGEFGATGGQFLKIYLLAALMMGLAGAVLGATMGGLFAAKMDKASFVVGFSIVFYTLYVGIYAYTKARVTNLVWNRTELGPLRFRSTLGARGLLWIYVSNALAILASAGLLIPWATIRTLRYRVEHFALALDGDLHQFHGSETSAVQAAGAEVGELFDFDMSI